MSLIEPPSRSSFQYIDHIMGEAIEKLKAAKEELFKCLAAHESLENEKTSLESIVDELRSEKTQLGFEIEKMKTDLGDFRDELTNTTPALHKDDEQDNDDESRNEHDSEDFGTFLDSRDTVFDSPQTPPRMAATNKEDNEEPVITTTSILEARYRSEKNQQSQTSSNATFFNDDDEAMSVVTASTTTSDASPKRHRVKRRARKVYNSPKKWRRMHRTHRLKSIFYNMN